MNINLQELMDKQRAYYNSGATIPVAFRKQQLCLLYDAVRKNEQEVTEAVRKDFGKPEIETFVTEIGFLLAEIRHAIKHIDKWVKPRKAAGSLALVGSKSYIVPEPLGLSLIIAPWNYPFQLALAPLVGAIAAGNCAILKPSELTPHTSAVIANLCAGLYPEEYITVVEGGVDVSTHLLEQRFDVIFFTGSTNVGRVVAEAAAKHLTPTILELGGKSPTIVHQDAKLDLAARRIVWGKFLNAGQTCVAPDYILVHKDIKEELILKLKQEIDKAYDDVMGGSTQFPSIINDRHFERLAVLLKDGSLVHGGRTDAGRRLIEPTLLTDVEWMSPVMQDEIFGPILPILVYSEIEEAVRQVKSRPKPLALYLFTESREVQQLVLENISFGGGCVNDTLMHLSSPSLPFGGVGPSGMGAYHGLYSFEAFSHRKSVLKQTTRFDMSIRYGRSPAAVKLLRRLLK
ncbi:aldehyde dehydrogenase family protein [Paenibacillus sambharensis]|uniref:Aldehyde dehydrogenase n=1 Tax=Paenibacillus sambharensis TaxID=1803190 RepID=A0A2W1M120_9BACL|nr:aldehyde dehydrogenase [Paenibacillus sambharensis]PZD97357.1 aldehyde dehydrogenase family protein [Paenibacillus sambharensis]